MIRGIHARSTGVGLAAVVLGLGGCAGGGDAGSEPTARLTAESPADTSPDGGTPTSPEMTTPGTTALPMSTAPATPDVRTLEITVASGEVSPPPSQVDLGVGETLRLVVTSDTGSEIHAHGFEIDAPVPAGQPTSIDLTGTTPGVYEVELHDPDLLLLQVAVR